MCAGLAVERRAIPNALIERYNLHDRIVKRKEGADEEIHFLFRAKKALLPVWIGNELEILEWGNRDNKLSKLPHTGWARIESIEKGLWQHLRPEEVEIPAAFGLEKGVWFQINEGMKGILVRDEKKLPHVYMLTQQASHYYEVMTRHNREPVFIGESI